MSEEENERKKKLGGEGRKKADKGRELRENSNTNKISIDKRD